MILFFAYTEVKGCNLICNFGDTCGPASTLAQMQTVISTPTAVFKTKNTPPLTWSIPVDLAPDPFVI